MSAAEAQLAAWAIVVAVLIWSYLWKCLAFWKAARRAQIGWYVVIALSPPFGLVEMTRKNVSAGLLESFSRVCEQCGGRGVLLFEDAATSGGPIPWADEAEG